MKKAIIYILFLFFSIVSIASTANQINDKNWTSHPKIKEIRKIYNTTEGLISSNKLKVKKRTFEYCEPYVDMDREIYINKNGYVRKYMNSKGSDDSSVTQSFYYGDAEKLRFIFAQCGALNGTKLEVRIYLDKKGNRLWEDHKLIKGPGYTFPNPWPIEEFVIHPKKDFESANRCEEIKN